jgi:hypothetical protein
VDGSRKQSARQAIRITRENRFILRVIDGVVGQSEVMEWFQRGFGDDIVLPSRLSAEEGYHIVFVS